MSIPFAPQSMDFGLGENADMIRETTARWAADRLAPRGRRGESIAEASRIGEGTHPMAPGEGGIVVRDAADGRCPVSLQLEVMP